MSSPDQKENKWTTFGAKTWVAPPPRPTGLAGTRFHQPGESKSAPNRSPAQGFLPSTRPSPRDVALVEEAHAAMDKAEVEMLREALAKSKLDRDPREANRDLPSDYNWNHPLFDANMPRSDAAPPAGRLEAAMKRAAVPRRRSMSQDSRALGDQIVQLWKEVDSKDAAIRHLVRENIKLREELKTERRFGRLGEAFTLEQPREMDLQDALAELRRRHRVEFEEVERAFGRQPSPYETPGSFGLPLDPGPREAGRGAPLFPPSPREYVYPLATPARRPADFGNPFGQ